MWEFFDQQPKAAGLVRWPELEDLKPNGRNLEPYWRRLAELFIEALKGRRKVLDIGCGAGMPALYVAPHVGELVGVDAAPRMVAAARANASRMGIANATFVEQYAEKLPFANEEFDGATLCGALESMDWETVHKVMGEVRRLLSPSARTVIVGQDRGEGRQDASYREVLVWHRDGRLMLSMVEATSSPYVTRRTRYVVDPQSPSARKLMNGLSNDVPARTALGPEDLAPEDILNAWYDEAVGFNAETLSRLVESYGFRDIRIRDVSGSLFLTASK